MKSWYADNKIPDNVLEILRAVAGENDDINHWVFLGVMDALSGNVYSSFGGRPVPKEFKSIMCEAHRAAYSSVRIMEQLGYAFRIQKV